MGNRSTPAKLDGEALWDYALRSLGRRAQSVSEIRQKLMRRAATPADVNNVLTRLREYGFADDQKFSESFAAVRLQNQGFGQQRVVRDLRAKRVSEIVAKQAVQSAYASTDEAELIAKFLERKYRGKDLREHLKDPKNMNSVYRRLRMAGFGSGHTLKQLRRYSEAIDEWEETDEESN